MVSIVLNFRLSSSYMPWYSFNMEDTRQRKQVQTNKLTLIYVTLYMWNVFLVFYLNKSDLKNKLKNSFFFVLKEISCLSCHLASYPFYGCQDLDDVTLEQVAAGTGEGSNLYYRGMDVVDKCETCGIEDTWHRTTGKFLHRRKLCFVTNVSSSGCAYEDPVGSEEVREVCYCNTNLCNLKDIASLGGSHDFKKFPKMQPQQRTVSMATRGLSGKEGFRVTMFIFVMVFCYFYFYNWSIRPQK